MFNKLKPSVNNHIFLENTSDINFEVLPAERKNRPVVSICMGCTSCCCCCCCAHAAGGIIGAAIATTAARSAVMSPVPGQQNKYDHSQQSEAIKSVQRLTWVYWIVLGISCLVSFLLSFLVISEIVLTSIVYFALVVPAMQILAIFISLPFLAIVPDRNAGFKALLKILLGSIVGMILGIMVMITGSIIMGIF